jgi:hypothetical protein
VKARVIAIVTALVALAVVLGTAGKGSAAAGMSVVLSPLIGTASNEVQQVTYGGKIGFHLEVANTGDSTANHLVVVVESDLATFSDASRAECARDPQNAKRMVCALQQMKPGAPAFSVDLRFTAPASGSAVVATPSVSVDAQSQGGSGNNGTQTVTGASVTTALVSPAGNSRVKTYARGKEAVSTSTTLPQHSLFTMPTSLLGGYYGVEISVQETTGTPLCSKCPAYVTQLDIPASLVASSPFSPVNAFSFAVKLLPAAQPPGYNPTGLYHDGALVPRCATSPLGPTTHICLNSFEVSNKNGILAAGVADQNGRIGFG